MIRPIDSIDCAACEGAGWTLLGGGPCDQLCLGCHGTGAATCRDCNEIATVLDCDAEEHGPTCEEHGIRCEYCQALATEVRGTESRYESVCASCGDELRIGDQRTARRAAWDDHCDSIRKEQAEERRAS